MVPGLAVHQPISHSVESEIDADSLIGLVVNSLARLLRLAGARRASRIRGVGAATFWHGLVVADESARALTPVFLWSDTRSWKNIAALEERIDPEEARQRTGCPIHPSYWPAKLRWLREERPDLWRRPVKWLSFGDLLYWRFFGNLGTSLSMASGTGLLRLSDCGWDEELMSELGIKPESLPPVANAEQKLRPRYGKLLPQLAAVPWLHAAGDGALANLGSGCTSLADRAITIGTSGALRVMHGGSGAPVAQGLWRYRLDESRLVDGGAVSNGGNLRDWLTANLRISPTFRPGAPGAHGLTFLPHLFGERSLGFAAQAFGAVAGLTGSSTARDVAQAAYEAVAVQFAQIDRRLDEVLPGAKRLVANGAALLNAPAWMQMIADAAGRPVVASRDKEATSRGAALFAMESLGMAAPAESRTGKVFMPDRKSSAAYRKIEARQAALYQALIGDRILS